MYQSIKLKKANSLFLVPLVIACFAFLPQMQAVVPAPDGCYPGFTTAEGCRALESLTTGEGNTGLGFWSLILNTDGNNNTAVGAQSLAMNNGSLNTAVGIVSLVFNMAGSENTAAGAQTLPFNDADGNSAFGAFAMFTNTTGGGNSAFGNLALLSNDLGALNSAFGAGALANNTVDGETAFGTLALASNQIALRNTAVGTGALGFNDNGGAGLANDNSAVGALALFNNTDASNNTAVGQGALLANDGDAANLANVNTAVGSGALLNNLDGDSNTAVGAFALLSQNGAGGFPIAVSNNAIGRAALFNNLTGSFNQAIGVNALVGLTDGSGNVAIGDDAGINYASTESGNILIGSFGVVGDNNFIRIGDTEPNGGIVLAGNGFNVMTIGPGFPSGGFTIFGNLMFIGPGIPIAATSSCVIGGIAGFPQGFGGTVGNVTIDTVTQRLGIDTSSRRYKEDIKPMDKLSETVLKLKPVSYRFKKEINPAQPTAFGLIAEEVEEINPDLVLHNAKGQPEGVHYQMVNVMLLNEFLKEHKKVEEQQASIAELKSTVAQQQKGMEVLMAQVKEQAAQIQKVSAQLEVSKPAPQVVTNKP